tara:strand:- start:925 stop:2646 length:1722 start_codon:yes stop_codon:yes gene_type:complete
MDIKVFQSIDPGDFKVTPFVATKTISITDQDYTNIGSKLFRGEYQQVRFQEQGFYLHNISASGYTQNALGTDYGLTSNGQGTDVNYHFIKQRFYGSQNPYESFGGNNDAEDRFLGSRVNLVSVPYNVVGEGFTPGTITITDNSTGTERTLSDDKKGNLIDNSVTNLAPSSSLITHFNFNGEFIDGLNLSLELQDTNKTLEIYKESNDVKGMVAKNGEDTDLKLYNIAYETGKWGLAAKFSGSKSYGQIDDSKYFDFPRNYDFAISMWIKIPPSQSYTTNSSNFIIGKNGNGIATINENLGGENKENQPGILSQSFATSSKFPFEITTFNQTSDNKGKINFSRRGGMFTPSTMTTQSFNDGEYHHVVAQRNTGSLEIYVDGVLHASSSDSTDENTRNESDLFIASRGSGGNVWDDSFSGSMDDVRIYSSSLSYSDIQNLYDNPSGTNKIGNVFYKDGAIAVTNPSSSYDKVFIATGSNGWNIKFDNKVSFYQYEAVCNVKEGQFMISNNPSLKKDDDINSEFFKDFATGSSFEPYITTIGLYNDDYQLVAIGKLAKPLPNNKDIAYTFSVRFDV